MKSNKNLIGIALLFLVMAVSTSLIFWADVSTSAKIAMFAYGFGSGVVTGSYIIRNRSQG